MISLFFSFFFISIFHSQSVLALDSCEDLFFETNDNSDSDSDGIVCEANVLLQNIGMYTSNEICNIDMLNWTILVDVNSDGDYDLEYKSDLPSNDDIFDDTNGIGIPDIYIAPTVSGQSQSLTITDIEGAYS